MTESFLTQHLDEVDVHLLVLLDPPRLRICVRVVTIKVRVTLGSGEYRPEIIDDIDTNSSTRNILFNGPTNDVAECDRDC